MCRRWRSDVVVVAAGRAVWRGGRGIGRVDFGDGKAAGGNRIGGTSSGSFDVVVVVGVGIVGLRL